MDVVGPLFAAADLIMREAALFAAAGFLSLGAGDLLVDLLWLWLKVTGAFRRRTMVDDLPPPRAPGRMAVFVPAWDEAAVIEAMLRGALAAFGEADFRLYVGCYPNDPATLAAAGRVEDPRIRLTLCPSAGPTTKADCLNALWSALLADEAAGGWRAKAIVLHDAEDVVHSAELPLFDRMIEGRDLVQLPVLPLIDPASRWVGGHYADEFAEAHGKEMVVRQWLGASLPSAGVGCAFAREALARVAAASGGMPFDAASLTEDYELGLRLRELGGRAAFVRIRAGPGRGLVATREYFPGTFAAAVTQKARWLNGIALSGWERLGWSGGAAERWMRLRDRQSLLAALLVCSGYVAIALWLLLKAREGLTGLAPAPLSRALSLLVGLNLGLFLWRLGVRAGFTAEVHGWREGLRAVPRAAIGNAIAIAAAVCALIRYRAVRRTGCPRWDKTAHLFPAQLPAE